MAILPGTAAVENVGVLITSEANLAGIEETKAGLAGMEEQTAAAGAGMSASLKGFSGGLSNLGKALLPVSAGILAVGGYSVKAAMDFQQSMTLIQTQAGASASEVKNLTQKVIDLAPVVGEGPKQLADALFFIESAGIHGAKALDVLKLAAEGAQVGDADLAATANALTSVMNTNIQGAQSAGQAMGILNAIVGAGKMHFDDLNAAISTGFLSTASTFGVSLQSAGAALADLTRQGMPAEAAATRLRMAMVLMSTPTAAAGNVLKGLGFNLTDAKGATSAMTDALAAAHVTTSQLSDDLRKPDGFLVATEDLKKHLEDSGLSADAADAAIAKAFGGGRSSGPLLAFLSNTKSLGDSFKSIQKNANGFADDWKKRQEDASFNWDKFKATLSADSVKLGTDLLPKVTRALDDIGKDIDTMSKKWDSLSPTAKSTISDIALVIGVGAPLMLALAKVIEAVGTIGTTMYTLSKPFLWLTAQFFQLAASATGSEGLAKVGAAIDGLRTGNLAALSASLSSFAGFGILAGAGVLAFAQIRNAANDANNAINNLQSAVVNKGNSDLAVIKQLQNTIKTGNPAAQARARATLNKYENTGSFATGTNYARGGWSMVGEQGPEMMYLPRGATVKTNTQSNAEPNRPNRSGPIINQTNNIYNQQDLDLAYQELGWRLAVI